MRILLTGGMGFVGSHIAVELIQKGYTVIIADNLVNSRLQVLQGITEITGVSPTFYQLDVTYETGLNEVFERETVDAVIHLAGLKAVKESVADPLRYYQNNLGATIALSKSCLKYGVKRLIFSSSATVYGNQPFLLAEDCELKKTENPYGETKAVSERILSDVAMVNPGFSVTILRYFNPVGAHVSGLIGELPTGMPNNIMPLLVQAALGRIPKILIYGDDYATYDGTGVRDYIHVVDLSKGHVAALDKESTGVNIYNLGTGKGTTVLEMLRVFEYVTGHNIPYEIVGRRPGDVAFSVANVTKAELELCWKADYGLERMVEDSWRFASRQNV